jgi:outer membrane lipoprotein SlyB
MKIKIIIIIMTSVSVIGCSKKAQTLDYYKAHIKEAEQVAKDCKLVDKTIPNVQEDCNNAVGALTWKMFKNGATSAPAYGTYKLKTSF